MMVVVVVVLVIMIDTGIPTKTLMARLKTKMLLPHLGPRLPPSATMPTLLISMKPMLHLLKQMRKPHWSSSSTASTLSGWESCETVSV